MPPVVGAEDSVTPPSTEGMTPAEAQAAMEEFQERVMTNARRIATEGRNVPPDPGVATPPPPPPNQAVTREEFNRMTESARAGLVFMAQTAAKEGKGDWDRHFKAVSAIVSQLPVEQQINKDVWQEAYYNVRGRATDTMIEEARRSALGLEAPSPPPAAPPKARVFTNDELNVIEGMGVTTKMYEDAEAKLSAGYQPFTTDNRRTA